MKWHAFFRLALLSYAFFGHRAHAQQAVIAQPDCIIFFHFTATGQTSPTAPNLGFSNLTNGCTTWNVSYANTGFSALSLVFQSAPNVSGAAGSWSTFANATILAGANPNTNTTGNYTQLTGYNPWVRMTLASSTGSGEVDGAVYGYRIPSAAGTITGTITVTGTVTANQGTANASPWPVTTGTSIAGADGQGNNAAELATPGGSAANAFLGTFDYGFNGATWDRRFICTNQASFNLSGSGNTQIIALSGSTVIRICHLSFATTAAEDVKVTQGTGSNCAGGTADVTGLYKSVSAMALDFAPTSALRGTAANAICINQSAVQALGGIVIYAQY